MKSLNCVVANIFALQISMSMMIGGIKNNDYSFLKF
jgi:hypothetical protein